MTTKRKSYYTATYWARDLIGLTCICGFLYVLLLIASVIDPY